MMLSHAQIWAGIDRMAQRYAMSASGLARLAGLDPTTFNKSKRFNGEMGKERWPSTESISKALEAVGLNFEEFAALAAGRTGGGRTVPLLAMALAGSSGYFDDAGYPTGTGWDEVALPGHDVDGVYVLEITGNSMEPLYREGDRVVVAPGSELRRGDRVVARHTSGELMIKIFGRRNDKMVELNCVHPEFPAREIPIGELNWIARIVLATQ
jgi:phage repressor protein C with HTH and peptisase S24 domain